jgi:hypothetical protein
LKRFLVVSFLRKSFCEALPLYGRVYNNNVNFFVITFGATSRNLFSSQRQNVERMPEKYPSRRKPPNERMGIPGIQTQREWGLWP